MELKATQRARNTRHTTPAYNGLLGPFALLDSILLNHPCHTFNRTCVPTHDTAPVESVTFWLGSKYLCASSCQAIFGPCIIRRSNLLTTLARKIRLIKLLEVYCFIQDTAEARTDPAAVATLTCIASSPRSAPSQSHRTLHRIRNVSSIGT